MRYELFTDGSCEPNPGVGGWAFILRPENNNLDEMVFSGGEKDTTNNRMELLAVIKGAILYKNCCHTENNSLLIFSDSKYIVDGINDWLEGWEKKNWIRSGNKPVLNDDLWKQILSLKKELPMKGIFVRGHSGHPENERCDKLATDQTKLLRKKQ